MVITTQKQCLWKNRYCFFNEILLNGKGKRVS